MEKEAFGYELCVDMFHCNPKTIRSKKKLIEYVNKLCKLIKMKKYGKAIVPWFGTGDVQGYSLVQLIETSSIVGHFSEKHNSAYIDIFSCKEYDAGLAEAFTKDFFEAGSIKTTYLVR
jgi:S-adenosylmethionine/arginine decarboxylase-like enzyme